VGDEVDSFSVEVDARGTGGTSAVLVLRGELDAYAAEHLTAAIEQIDPGASGVDLDLTGVSFVDSSGLRVLLQAGDRIDGRAATTLRHAQPPLLRLLELTGLLDQFTLVS
jgi:anti-sigma B factor antagonist